MTQQLIMPALVGEPFDWTLACSDFARAWTRGALAARQRPDLGSPGLSPPRVQFDLWPGEVLDAPPAWAKDVGRPDRKWSSAPRPMSIPTRRLTRREKTTRAAREQFEAVSTLDVDRPRTRADCADGPRPCPWVSCRQHLYLDVSEKGWLKLNHPHLAVEEMTESCALDVADRDGITLERLGQLLNISLEGARQVEADVMEELRAKLGVDAVAAILGSRE
jgi:hypothetical protein